MVLLLSVLVLICLFWVLENCWSLVETAYADSALTRVHFQLKIIAVREMIGLCFKSRGLFERVGARVLVT